MPENQLDADTQRMLEHPLRANLIDLLRDRSTFTSTEAARELGVSSGLCSFHLRRLAEFGLIEEAAPVRGHVRPWRLAGRRSAEGPEFVELARGLEDESYQQWLAHCVQVPRQWQVDQAFSEVLYLIPAELAELGDQIRKLLEPYRHRENSPTARPEKSGPVAILARLLPMLGQEEAPEDT